MSLEIHNCDCLDLKPSKPVNLVYLDPPYSYEKEDVYYGVGKTLDEYLEFIVCRLKAIKELCATSYNILMQVDYKAVHYLKVEMDKLFGRQNFRNEIIWSWNNPSRCKSYLPRKHNSILWYGIGNYAFNEARTPYKNNLRVGGKASWAGDVLDVKAYKDRGRLLTDVWDDIPALCRNESEKLGYATQKPMKLLNRLVKMFSNEGDVVMDPFMGSGTTIEAALVNKRFIVGCDTSKEACELTLKRLQKLAIQSAAPPDSSNSSAI